MQFSADIQILFASSLYPRHDQVLQVHITSLVGGTAEVQKSTQRWPWATCLIRRLTWLHTRLG